MGTMQLGPAAIPILEILIRMARHSLTVASEIARVRGGSERTEYEWYLILR